MVLDGKLCMEVKERLDAVNEDIDSSMIIVRYWFKEFQLDCKTILDEEHQGLPIKVITDEMI